MSLQQRLDPELALVVSRIRKRAAAAGELRPSVIGEFVSPFPLEARAIVVDWRRGGGYKRALAEIGSTDPDLAVQ